MIAVDTNILVYAHRRDSQFHQSAQDAVAELAQGRGPWALPWPVIHEFLAVVTHPKIYDPPTPLPQALDQVDAWLESPSLVLLGETSQSWPELRSMLESSRVVGPKVHDARVAALARGHGVEELLTADRDFGRFSGVPVRNPLI
jgi:toxin-antitoxin system PIN domain toxin